MAVDIKSILGNALLIASERRSLDKITVTELLHETGVGRRTFYAYFSDKYDLIRWVFVNRIVDECVQGSDVFLMENERFYQKLLEHRRFVKQAFKMEGQNCLRSAMFDIVFNEMKRRSAERNVVCDDNELYYHAFAMSEICSKWVTDDFPVSAHEMACRIKSAREKGIKDII